MDRLLIRISLPDAAVRQRKGLFHTTTDAVFRQPLERLDRPAGTQAPGHRGRRRDHPAVGPALDQRLLDRWSRPTPGPQGQGSQSQSDCRLGPILRQWVIDGPAKQGLDRANWTYAEPADRLLKTKDIRVRKAAIQAFGANMASIRTGRRTGSSAPARQGRRRPGRNGPPSKNGGRRRLRPAESGRGPVPYSPARTAALDVKDRRPVDGT
jgi:hypothetical protein